MNRTVALQRRMAGVVVEKATQCAPTPLLT